MITDFLYKKFSSIKDSEAIIWNEKVFKYGFLLERIQYWQNKLSDNDIAEGSVVALEGDFSPNTISLFLVLIEKKCIIVPLTEAVSAKKNEFLKTAQVEIICKINKYEEFSFERIGKVASHKFINTLKSAKNAGLILFSSGTTGECKAALHNFEPIIEKFKIERRALRTISFLLYDHIGGVNTLLYTLSNGGCLITLQDRSTQYVLNKIEEYKAELLPATPTFLNLILLSESNKSYNLDSLELVTYGTEPMPQSTLERFHNEFPNIRLLQTYGLSELGILRSKSKSSDSLWVKIGGENFQTRVINNLLEIKAKSAMLGYLNAPSPFSEDGWFKTGDRVEVDGEYFKILGRESEIINVGGQKVFPVEIESVVQNAPNVEQVVVFSEKNAIIGEIVCAKIYPSIKIGKKELSIEIKKYCKNFLQTYQIPVKIIISKDPLHNKRFKQERNSIDIKSNLA